MSSVVTRAVARRRDTRKLPGAYYAMIHELNAMMAGMMARDVRTHVNVHTRISSIIDIMSDSDMHNSHCVLSLGQIDAR
jgi:hypothetical protein